MTEVSFADSDMESYLGRNRRPLNVRVVLADDRAVGTITSSPYKDFPGFKCWENGQEVGCFDTRGQAEEFWRNRIANQPTRKDNGK